MPVLFSWIIMCLVLGVFSWYFFVLSFMFNLILIVIWLMMKIDLDSGVISRLSGIVGFVLFLIIEALAFLGLLISCYYYSSWDSLCLSSYNEIPFIGCSLLFSSSVLVQWFSINCILGNEISCLGLYMGIIFGVLFIIIELLEFKLCSGIFVSAPYVGFSYVVVIFHLLHVMLGLLGLGWCGLSLSKAFFSDSCVVKYRLIFIMGYWHFVDVVWFFVYYWVYYFN